MSTWLCVYVCVCVYIWLCVCVTVDHVFMGDHELCKQYVLSDVGDIFYGNERQISARPWNYGQVRLYTDRYDYGQVL